MVLDDATYGIIDTAIDTGNPTDCSEDAASGLIDAIDTGDLMDFADASISDNAADVLIDTSIDSTDYADTNVSDDAVDGLMVLVC